MKHKLWYREPANNWDEALPLGNGRLGVMVFGGINKEELQLNEESIWAGPPVPEILPSASAALKEATELLRNGENQNAEKIIQEEVMADRISPRSYQTMGSLFIEEETTSTTNYSRELDLKTAIHTTSWLTDGSETCRETFVSKDREIIVCHTFVRSGKCHPAKLSFKRESDSDITYKDNTITVTDQAHHNGKHRGVKFITVVKVYSSDGGCYSDDTGIYVSNTAEYTIVITCQTDYNREDPTSPLLEKLMETSFDDNPINYQIVKEEHIREYKEFYNRVDFKLGEEDFSDIPTDELLAEYRDRYSTYLLTLYFHYARYLLISCSRPDTICANLQGIWNKDIEAPWNADYHININIQMIYWLVDMVDLPECHRPFFDYMERLVPSGRVTAREVYNCRGSVVHHTSDPWYFTAPCGDTTWGMWPLGAAWSSRHFVDHYRFTGDREFLKTRAYPYLKETVLFLYDYLVEVDGKLLFGPASSPENLYILPGSGEQCNVDLGITMGQQIVRESFSNFIYILDELNINDPLKSDIEKALSQLKSDTIADDGRLLEWSREYNEVEPGHRHLSHLYALYPGEEYLDREDYLNASQKSMEYRLKHGGGHTGWSRAWIINLWARLKNSNEVKKNIDALLEESTLKNLLDNHPPFQLDGNIGGAAGLLEMIVQSNNGVITLFPALPEDLNTGSFKGIKLRGGFCCSLKWKDGIAEISILSKLGNPLIILDRDGVEMINIETQKGEEYIFSGIRY